MFAGDTADPNMLAPRIEKQRERFGIERVVLVGDRGMITGKRIDQSLWGVERLDWINALLRKKFALELVASDIFRRRCMGPE